MGTDPLDESDLTNDEAQPEEANGQSAGERHRAADARDAAADQREKAADAREVTADRRETAANKREAAADQRDAAADAWQNGLAAHEKRLDLRRRAAGDPTPSIRKRSYEQIGRSQALLASSQERLNRSEAALRRADAADLREQDTINREMAAGAKDMAAKGPVPLKALQARADLLRERAVAATEALARTEDALADEHGQRHRARDAAGHRHRAAQARTASEALRATTEPPEDKG
ncbi:hypothetical protein [Streptomyces sp. RK9]|uniref:hypothetical protein n=1 Tax=Streptomyces sp. RK9 TaxID=3239284 RepID=UPI003865A9BF